MNVVVAAYDVGARAGLRARLLAAGVGTSGEAGDEATLDARLESVRGAIIVTGPRWPEVAPLLGRAIGCRRPAVALLEDRDLGPSHPAFRRGAAAVLPWELGPRPLAAALQAVSEGLRVVPAVPAATVHDESASERVLSAREHEVLELVAAGLPTKLVARRLGLSPNTVKHHVAAIFRKLGARTRAEAYGAALRRGELSI